jgi:hypothetical protein
MWVAWWLSLSPLETERRGSIGASWDVSLADCWPDPAAGVAPASFQDYKPGGEREGTNRARSFWRLCGVKQIIRELRRQAAGEKLEPEQLKGLIRAGYVYRNGDEHLLTDMGRDALAQPGVYPREEPPGTEIVEAFGHPGE